jgi:uncharacterized protein YbbC (DUF1343 family)
MLISRYWLCFSLLLFLGITDALAKPIQTGADQPQLYLQIMQGKRLGVIANPTSRVGEQHLVDFLLEKKQNIVKVFAPEHGFRGEAEAGAHIINGLDARTQLPIVSLYGKNKQPSAKMLTDIDLLVFDIQDVGVRYYTYISTLHYLMAACAENNKPLLVLDRPNPNGAYIDGPSLEPAWRSFVGMHPIPLLHGLTVGELAKMINGENWLNQGQCKLTIVPVANYQHSMTYDLPVPPSPNLPNRQAIQLYPSLGFFEGTPISVGRGTEFPFQVLGAPDKAYGSFQFKPLSIPGKSLKPMHENQVCYGRDLRKVKTAGLNLGYLITFYQNSAEKNQFFNPFFDKLAGTDKLRRAIQAGKSESEIRQSWGQDLKKFRALRSRYLIYQD